MGSLDSTCPVCWEDTPQRVNPCKHALCDACAARWFRKSAACPLCRQDVAGLAHWKPPKECQWIRVAHSAGTHFGITLCDHPQGVVVTRLNGRDRCAVAGIRKGMVLQHINGIRCTKASFAIRVMHAIATDDACVVTVIRDRSQRIGLSQQIGLFKLFRRFRSVSIFSVTP